MLVAGIALLTLSFVGLWFCLPGKDSKVKSYLRNGADVMAAILITAGLGLGAIVFIVGIAKF